MTLQLLERVAGGATADIYRARWGGQPCAAKVLDPRWSLDECEMEAEAIRLAQHPAFIDVIELTQLDGRWALVLEWVDGVNLTTLLDRTGPLDEAQVEAILGAALEALSVAWESSGLLHRDLKPANLMLQVDGTVRIADLGLAAHATSPQHTRGSGSPEASAPERYAGVCTPKSEVYALGCVAYALLVGRSFGMAGPHERAHRRRVRAARADLMERGVSTELADTIASMLAFEPADRPTYAELDFRPNPTLLNGLAWRTACDRS